MDNAAEIKAELAMIDALLQDQLFTEAMAVELDAAYYRSIGQEPPPFLLPGEDTLLVEKSLREEKIAINMAIFYGLECGINYLCSYYNNSPMEWLEKIISKKTDDFALLILNRFANATWKASQPFMGLDRIKLPDFTGASSLSEADIQKNHRQVISVAQKLQASLNAGTKEEQLVQIKILLHDKDYAAGVAAFMDTAYYTGENKPITSLINSDEAAAVKKKSFKAEKIAINIAGFYALECGLNYLVTIRKQLPSSILTSIVEGNIPEDDKLLFERFANATWKAGQPFRSLDRIMRDIFTPFNFLSEADIEKDWAQVKAAATKLLSSIRK